VTSSYLIKMPPGTRLINANGRSSKNAVSGQSYFKARMGVKGHLRAEAKRLALEQGIPLLGRVRIKVTYYAPDNRRRDSSNVSFLSSKACIDGIVDAGVLLDDNDKWVKSLELVRGDHNVPKGQLVIELIEVATCGGISI
jgi:crossover junction endodeoxyribonuclease RusA